MDTAHQLRSHPRSNIATGTAALAAGIFPAKEDARGAERHPELV
jgi:hypothetical protein